MKIVKILAYGILSLALWQVLSLQLLGTPSLMKQVGTQMESMVDGNIIADRYYYTQLPFANEQQKTLRQRYQETSTNIQFYSGSDTSLWKLSPDTYTYYVSQDIDFWGQANVYESEHAYSKPGSAFFCDWRSKYIWVLFTWVHLEKDMKSIT